MKKGRDGSSRLGRVPGEGQGEAEKAARKGLLLVGVGVSAGRTHYYSDHDGAFRLQHLDFGQDL